MSNVIDIRTERPETRDVRREELERVVGGIETIPLPEFLAIGTWPTPERPRDPWFRALSRFEV